MRRRFFEFLMPRIFSSDCEGSLTSTVKRMEIASRPGPLENIGSSILFLLQCLFQFYRFLLHWVFLLNTSSIFSCLFPFSPLFLVACEVEYIRLWWFNSFLLGAWLWTHLPFYFLCAAPSRTAVGSGLTSCSTMLREWAVPFLEDSLDFLSLWLLVSLPGEFRRIPSRSFPYCFAPILFSFQGSSYTDVSDLLFVSFSSLPLSSVFLPLSVFHSGYLILTCPAFNQVTLWPICA